MTKATLCVPKRSPILEPLRGLAFALAICLFPGFMGISRAEAGPMTFRLERTDARPVGLDLYQIIWADGEIAATSGAELRTFAANNHLIAGAYVYLNSPGGSLGGGVQLGRAIRSLGFNTDVGRPNDAPGQCLSACAYAYLGGTFRYMRESATFGVHRFSGDLTVDDAQIVSGVLAAYIQEMGASPELFQLMTISGAAEMLVIPLADLTRLHVVNNGVASTTWDIRNVEGVGFYLRGTVVTDRGEHKMVFVCHANRLFAIPMLGSPDPPAVIQTYGSASWILNGDFQPALPSGVGVPEAESARVSTQVPVDASLYRRIVMARSIGFAWVHRNNQLFSGFEIGVAEAHESIRTFARTCNASLYR